MCAIGAAVLVATNPWDIFVVAAALAVGTVAAARQRCVGVLRLAVTGAASVAAVAAIRGRVGGRNRRRRRRSWPSYLTTADFAPAWRWSSTSASSCLPLLVLAVVLAASDAAGSPSCCSSVAGAAVGLLIHSSAAALALAAAVVLGACALRADDRPARLVWALAALAMAAVVGVRAFSP